MIPVAVSASVKVSEDLSSEVTIPSPGTTCRNRSDPDPFTPVSLVHRGGVTKPAPLDPRQPPPKRLLARELVGTARRSVPSRHSRASEVPKHSPRPAICIVVHRSTPQPPMVPILRAPPERRTAISGLCPPVAAEATSVVQSCSHGTRHQPKLGAEQPSPPEAYALSWYLRWAWAIGSPAEADSDPARESRPFAAGGRSRPYRTRHPLVRGNRSCVARAAGTREIHSAGAEWSHEFPETTRKSILAYRVFSPRESASFAPVV